MDNKITIRLKNLETGNKMESLSNKTTFNSKRCDKNINIYSVFPKIIVQSFIVTPDTD